MSFFHAHAHSHYSVLDGMPTVTSMVRRAARHGQPGLALTDHGVMSGVAELYRACRAEGILPFPGEEFYVVQDVSDTNAPRYHLTMIAFTNDGYQGLLDLSSRSHQRDHYHYKPRVDYADLAELAESPAADGIAVMTGCYFGLLIQKIETTRSTKQGEHIVGMLKEWFPHVFVEVQNHHQEHDAEWVKRLWSLAQKTKTPVICTQDSHYVSRKHQEIHDLMKRIAYRGSDDASFPGDSYHLASTSWMKSHYADVPEVWEASLESMQWLLDNHTLQIATLDNYTYHVPEVKGQHPDFWLDTITRQALEDLGLDADPKYQNRRLEELTVIQHLGMAGYFHLIHRGVAFANQKGIMVNARGSANGSLVCYLLGITQLDPIKYKLLFERFLARDRKKPPDIDLDIEDVRRDDVVGFYRNQYDVTQIGTYNTLGEDIHGKGSILVQFLSWARQEYGDQFEAMFGDVKYIDDLPPDLGKDLRILGQMRVKKSPGAHAAGFVLGTDDHPIRQQIPTMLIPSSGHEVTQFTMDDVEALGYIKVDLLGQRTLTTVRRCLEMIGRDPNDGLTWIPDDDSRTLTMLRQGRTETGIFQFEGWAAARGCRELKVRKTKDCIAIMALYRPAVMASGYLDVYLNNRSGKTKPQYPHPVLKRHLRETHGVAIYQEQVMSVLRDVGVPYEELNQFLSALKMSNHKSVIARRIFKEQRQRFIDLARQNVNMTRNQATEVWEYIAGFAGYGFNRAHASAYGLLGYRTAYLKCHYPLEYMAALLETTAGTPKEAIYAKEARRIGVKLLSADVNVSQAVWTLDTKRKALRKGLTSIKGVGLKAAENIVTHAPFNSIEDMIERVDGRAVTGGREWAKHGTLRGVMEALRQGGALRSLGVDPF